MPKRKPSENIQLKLRFGEALRRKLERVARANGHSLNTEIVSRLERSFEHPEAQFGGAENVVLMRKLAATLDHIKHVQKIAPLDPLPNSTVVGLAQTLGEICATAAPQVSWLQLSVPENDQCYEVRYWLSRAANSKADHAKEVGRVISDPARQEGQR